MATVANTLASDSWAQELRAALNEDPAWRNAARWLSGRLELRHETGSLQVAIADGVPAAVSLEPDPHGSDVVIEAGEEGWSRLLTGELDFLSGGAAGQVTMRGDLVLAMHEMRTLHFTLAAMRRVAGFEPPEPSPDPAAPSAEVSGHYVEVDGIRAYYEEAGAGIPLVCLHAAAQDSLMYRHVLDGLSDRFRVIVPDAPGHGKTAVPSGGYFTSITQHAEFNERLMAALGIEDPILVGCSMAGNMVLELGARRPAAYRAIVSCEGAAHTPTIDDFTLDMLDSNGAVLVEAFARSLTGNRTPPDRADEVAWQIARATPAVMKADLIGYTSFDQRAALGQIEAPTLLIRGDADWLVTQEMVESTAAAIPTSRIDLLEGTGHYPMIENPVEFNAAVARFLGDVVVRSASAQG